MRGRRLCAHRRPRVLRRGWAGRGRALSVGRASVWRLRRRLPSFTCSARLGLLSDSAGGDGRGWQRSWRRASRAWLSFPGRRRASARVPHPVGLVAGSFALRLGVRRCWDAAAGPQRSMPLPSAQPAPTCWDQDGQGGLPRALPCARPQQTDRWAASARLSRLIYGGVGLIQTRGSRVVGAGRSLVSRWCASRASHTHARARTNMHTHTEAHAHTIGTHTCTHTRARATHRTRAHAHAHAHTHVPL